jgi:hypothetical protein
MGKNDGTLTKIADCSADFVQQRRYFMSKIMGFE